MTTQETKSDGPAVLSSVELDAIFPAKVRCETWVESKRVQILLADRVGCKWGNGIAAPWKPKLRKLLVILRGPNGLYFSWATSRDFEIADFPEIAAAELLASNAGAVR